MSFELQPSQVPDVLRDPNRCAVTIATRVVGLLDSTIPDEKKTAIRMHFSQNAQYGKRLVRDINANQNAHRELALRIAGHVERHTFLDGHLKEKCLPVREAAQRKKK